MESNSKLKMAIEANTDAMIGLRFISELQTAKDLDPPEYECQLCDVRLSTQFVVSHITCLQHRANYMEKYHPDKYAECERITSHILKRSFLETHSRIVEAMTGREEITWDGRPKASTSQDQQELANEPGVSNTVANEGGNNSSWMDKGLAKPNTLVNLLSSNDETEAETLSGKYLSSFTCKTDYTLPMNTETFVPISLEFPQSEAKMKNVSANIAVLDTGQGEVVEEKPITTVQEGTIVTAKCYELFTDLDDVPLVGLKYITEFQVDTGEPSYVCGLCGKDIEMVHLVLHLTGFQHRRAFLKQDFPESYKKVAKNPRAVDANVTHVESMYGRDSVTVLNKAHPGGVTVGPPGVTEDRFGPTGTTPNASPTHDASPTPDASPMPDASPTKSDERLPATGKPVSMLEKMIEQKQCTLPFLGLGNITEVQRPQGQDPTFNCTLCYVNKLTMSNIVSHISSMDHRMNFFEKLLEQDFPKVSQLSNESFSIYSLDFEQKHGRESVRVITSSAHPAGKQDSYFDTLVHTVCWSGALVGLSNILEIWNHDEQLVPRYECILCDIYDLTVNNVIRHVSLLDHKRKFIRTCLGIRRGMNTKEFAEKYEEKHGRESVKVITLIHSAGKPDSYFDTLVKAVDWGGALVGLSNILEIWNHDEQLVPRYECCLCDIYDLTAKNVIRHVSLLDHRSMFFRTYVGNSNSLNTLSKDFAEEYEERHGRESVRVITLSKDTASTTNKTPKTKTAVDNKTTVDNTSASSIQAIIGNQDISSFMTPSVSKLEVPVDNEDSINDEKTCHYTAHVGNRTSNTVTENKAAVDHHASIGNKAVPNLTEKETALEKLKRLNELQRKLVEELTAPEVNRKLVQALGLKYIPVPVLPTVPMAKPTGEHPMIKNSEEQICDTHSSRPVLQQKPVTSQHKWQQSPQQHHAPQIRMPTLPQQQTLEMSQPCRIERPTAPEVPQFARTNTTHKPRIVKLETTQTLNIGSPSLSQATEMGIPNIIQTTQMAIPSVLQGHQMGIPNISKSAQMEIQNVSQASKIGIPQSADVALHKVDDASQSHSLHSIERHQPGQLIDPQTSELDKFRDRLAQLQKKKEELLLTMEYNNSDCSPEYHSTNRELRPGPVEDVDDGKGVRSLSADRFDNITDQRGSIEEFRTQTQRSSENYDSRDIVSSDIYHNRDDIPSDGFDHTRDDIPSGRFYYTTYDIPSETFDFTRDDIQSDGFDHKRNDIQSDGFDHTRDDIPSEKFDFTRDDIPSEMLDFSKYDIPSARFDHTRDDRPSEIVHKSNTIRSDDILHDNKDYKLGDRKHDINRSRSRLHSVSSQSSNTSEVKRPCRTKSRDGTHGEKKRRLEEQSKITAEPPVKKFATRSEISTATQSAVTPKPNVTKSNTTKPRLGDPAAKSAETNVDQLPTVTITVNTKSPVESRATDRVHQTTKRPVSHSQKKATGSAMMVPAAQPAKSTPTTSVKQIVTKSVKTPVKPTKGSATQPAKIVTQSGMLVVRCKKATVTAAKTAETQSTKTVVRRVKATVKQAAKTPTVSSTKPSAGQSTSMAVEEPKAMMAVKTSQARTACKYEPIEVSVMFEDVPKAENQKPTLIMSKKQKTRGPVGLTKNQKKKVKARTAEILLSADMSQFTIRQQHKLVELQSIPGQEENVKKTIESWMHNKAITRGRRKKKKKKK